MFTLGVYTYGRPFFTCSVSYVTANGAGPPCLVVRSSHVAFSICDRTFLDGLRVQRSGANGVVYMKYGGRSDDGEQPPRRRHWTPRLGWKGAGPAENHNNRDVTGPAGWYESHGVHGVHGRIPSK